MKKLMLGLAILGALALESGPVRAQCVPYFQSAPGPYYPTLSWDQKLPADTRFLCLSDWNNEAVLDRETGLVWQRAPVPPMDTKFTQSDAVNFCYNANIGGRGGWRLPAPEELMSLVDFSQSNPALPPGNPFIQVGTLPYWTASTQRPGQGIAFQPGPGSTTTLAADDPEAVWCVRGGSHVLTDFFTPGP